LEETAVSGWTVRGAKLGSDGSPGNAVPPRPAVAGCDENSQHRGDYWCWAVFAGDWWVITQLWLCQPSLAA